MEQRHRVVIIGGGFGGLNAAKALAGAPVDVLLLDRRNFHLFQPLLYQVATGGLSPANIASPLRSVLRRQANVEVWLADVSGIDVARRRVQFQGGEVAYDTLVVAAGASHHYFGKNHWEEWAPGLKTIEDGTEIRRRILTAFEEAERESDPGELAAWLTFVIIGGGPTGVELAGAVGELAHHTLRRNFRRIDPALATVMLLEGLDRILSTYPPKLSSKAAEALRRLGVTVRTGVMVQNVLPDRVVVREGNKTSEIRTRTVLWAAGVEASPLGKALAEGTGASVDRAGRVIVQPDLTIAKHPEIFVIGDMAHGIAADGKPLPGVAQVAIQQGRYVAGVIRDRLAGKEPRPFRYRDYGSLATIGRAAAVADLGWICFSGYFAWLVWLFVHLVNLVGFQNRVLVLVQWAVAYFTRNRSARLITGEGKPARSSAALKQAAASSPPA